jgi:hypothetical protein
LSKSSEWKNQSGIVDKGLKNKFGLELKHETIKNISIISNGRKIGRERRGKGKRGRGYFRRVAA